jgi:transketolase N-terminal domain/subunit
MPRETRAFSRGVQQYLEVAPDERRGGIARATLRKVDQGSIHAGYVEEAKMAYARGSAGSLGASLSVAAWIVITTKSTKRF